MVRLNSFSNPFGSRCLKGYCFVFVILLLSACDRKRNIRYDDFYAVLPCADCNGINVHLQFYESSNYTAFVLYGEKGAKVNEYDGVYKYLNDSMISLNNADLGLGNLLIQDENLQMLDRQNRVIHSDFARNYRFYHVPPERFTLMPQAQEFKQNKVR